MYRELAINEWFCSGGYQNNKTFVIEEAINHYLALNADEEGIGIVSN
ncbi:MAG: hypothetical protein ACOYOE_14365 [Chlorobium sp.]